MTPTQLAERHGTLRGELQALVNGWRNQVKAGEAVYSYFMARGETRDAELARVAKKGYAEAADDLQEWLNNNR